MAQKCAFEAAIEGLSSATVQVGDGETFDIVAHLKKGQGQIVLDPETHGPIVSALSVHPAVKAVKPKGKES